jgi:hypothetical protein
VRPKCGTVTSIHIQDPDTNFLELIWYLQDASWATPSSSPKERTVCRTEQDRPGIDHALNK